MDPISLAMGLAQFAPQIIKWVTGSDKAAEAATQVVDIAKQVTGQEDPEKALEAVKLDPAVAMQFRQAIMANETELDRMYLADVQSARDRDTKLVQAGQRNFRADSMYILSVASVLALVYVVLKDPTLNEYAKGIITLVLGRFLGYLDSIYNFEFGTTRQSRNKDDTIKALSGK